MPHRAIAFVLIITLVTGQIGTVLANNDPVLHPERPESWIGREAIELFEAWGSPNFSSALEGGGALLIYRQGRKIGVVDRRPYDSLSRKQGTILQGDIQFATDKFNQIVEFRYLDDEPKVSKAAWFWGGFTVGVVASITALLITLVIALGDV